jgi:outer membrane immunogenic protein
MRALLRGSVVIAAMVGGSAWAADLPVYKAPVAAPAPVFTWTGFYVGANAGYSWGRASVDITETQFNTATVTTPTSTASASATITSVGSGRTTVNGGLGGVQAGYNWQTDRFVWGLEGDIQGTGQRGRVIGLSETTVSTADYSLQWFSTVRGRVGVTFDRVVFYGTGGLAIGGIKTDVTDAFIGLLPPAFPVAAGSSTAVRTGWAAGAGVEGAIGNGWSIKAEYLHLDFGSITQSATGTGASSFALGNNTVVSLTTALTPSFRARITDDIFRVGVNYKLDWAGL